MTVGDKGQVTIPKELRDRFGLGPRTEVEFHVVEGALVLRKKSTPVDFAKWSGRCAAAVEGAGLSTSDEIVEALRGK